MSTTRNPRDTAVAAVLVVAGLVTLPLIDRISDVDRPVDALAAALVVATGAVTVFRRRWPELTALAAAVGASTYLIVGYPFGPILIAVAVAVYAVARHRHLKWAAAWATPTLVVLLGHLLVNEPGIAGLIPGTAWVVVPFTLGAARRLVVEAQERARAETERRIVDAERLRLAQEVHDVVGHGLAAIQMQADIALHLRDARPAMAHEALAAISAASAEALDELRVTLAAIASRPGAADLGPMPGLARVTELCDRVRTAGVAVNLTVDGIPRPLPAAADVVAYRVLQEALTNVVKHSAQPHAEVAIHHRPDHVDLEVINEAPSIHPCPAEATRADHEGRAPGGSSTRTPPTGYPERVIPATRTEQAPAAGHVDGFGITGMRRRVEQVGGTLTAGPVSGIFAVAAVIPRELS